MNKFLLAVFTLVTLPSCARLEFPNLVSDSVQAGQNLYRSVRADARQAPRLDHSVLGNEDQSLAELKRQCIDEASRKLQLVIGGLQQIRELDIQINNVDRKLIVRCSVQAEPQA